MSPRESLTIELSLTKGHRWVEREKGKGEKGGGRNEMGSICLCLVCIEVSRKQAKTLILKSVYR